MKGNESELEYDIELKNDIKLIKQSLVYILNEVANKKNDEIFDIKCEISKGEEYMNNARDANIADDSKKSLILYYEEKLFRIKKILDNATNDYNNLKTFINKLERNKED